MLKKMFDCRTTKLCAALLSSIAVAACSSSSDDSLLGVPEVTGDTNQVGLEQLELDQMVLDQIEPQPMEPDLLEPIAAFLKADVADNIQLDDGLVPLTDGNWARFTPNTTWNWQLSGALNSEPDADVYVVDMFAQLQDKSIEPLHALGRQVICYFSAGTYEPWRPDEGLFAQFELGKPYIGFDNENWLNINNPEIVKLMVNRLDMAVALGCDGVELDNVDAFVNDTGFNITQNDALIYTRVLANEAHKRGLAVALKNNVELVEDVVDYFDLLINEECFQYNECEGYLPIIEAGKPVFNAEYTEEHINDPVAREELCVRSRDLGFQTLFLPLALDGSFRLSCQ